MKKLIFFLMILMLPSLSFANEIKTVESLYTINLDKNWKTEFFNKDGNNYYISYEYIGEKEIGFKTFEIYVTKFNSQDEIEEELSRAISWVVKTPFTMESLLDFIVLRRYNLENLRFITEFHQCGKSHFYIDYYFVVTDYLIRIDFPTRMGGDWDYYKKNIQSIIYEIKFKEQ